MLGTGGAGSLPRPHFSHLHTAAATSNHHFNMFSGPGFLHNENHDTSSEVCGEWRRVKSPHRIVFHQTAHTHALSGSSGTMEPKKTPKFFFGLSSSHSQNISLVQLFEPGFGFQYGSDHPLSITGYPLCFFGRYPPLRAFMSFPSHVKQRPLQHQMISNNAQRYFHLIISLISSRPLQNSSSTCAR